MNRLRLLLAILILALLVLTDTYSAQVTGHVGVPLRGVVVLPDGSPAVGATVNVESLCGQNHHVRSVETKSAGSFRVRSFSPDCNDYKFNADLKREMWLPTGSDIFYLEPNGTTPMLRVESGKTPEPVTIRLQRRGGEAEFKVRDVATGSYLEAGISLRRSDTFGKSTGIVTFIVPTEGRIDLLPASRYRIEVDRYTCGTKNIWLVNQPGVEFELISGERHQVIVDLDSRTAKVRSSYDNVRADRCTP